MRGSTGSRGLGGSIATLITLGAARPHSPGVGAFGSQRRRQSYDDPTGSTTVVTTKHHHAGLHVELDVDGYDVPDTTTTTYTAFTVAGVGAGCDATKAEPNFTV